MHCVVLLVSKVQGEGKVTVQLSHVDVGLEWQCQWRKVQYSKVNVVSYGSNIL